MNSSVDDGGGGGNDCSGTNNDEVMSALTLCVGSHFVSVYNIKRLVGVKFT